MDRVVAEALDRPFDWATHNCCTFARDVVLAITGVDYLPSLEGVDSVRSAMRAVQPYGSLSDAVTSVLGEPVPPETAQYGDILLVPDTEGVGDSIGVCVGPSVLVPGKQGLVRAPISRATQAWRLPVAGS
jgi:hypothetical protein